MFDASISWLSNRAGHTFGLGEPFPRFGTRHPSAAPFGVFSTGSENIVIAASSQSLWTDLCKTIDREDLLEDERLSTREQRLEHHELIAEELESTFHADPERDWISYLQANGVPAGPINDTETIWDDPHVKERELRVSMERESGPDAEMIDHPIHFSELATSLRMPPPELGESTDEILKRHGISSEELAELRNKNVIG
jgi:crotonobetainyl-CoA:carnitine CoA-transferase CaiB-like acyl-CoA transferase